MSPTRLRTARPSRTRWLLAAAMAVVVLTMLAGGGYLLLTMIAREL